MINGNKLDRTTKQGEYPSANWLPSTVCPRRLLVRGSSRSTGITRRGGKRTADSGQRTHHKQKSTPIQHLKKAPKKRGNSLSLKRMPGKPTSWWQLVPLVFIALPRMSG